jgi:cysteinyl-tRNA synthetase
MNNLMGAYEWRSDTHPVQEVQHWIQIAKQYQEQLSVYKVALHDADTEIERLKALCTKMDGWLGQRKCQFDNCKELAASQAREKVLREALELSEQHFIPHNWKVSGEALAQQSDDSELRKYVANEIRKMVQHGEDNVWFDFSEGSLLYADRYEKGMV